MLTRFALAMLLLSTAALAEKRGGWQDVPQHVRDWLQAQKQPGSGLSCCGIADAVNVEVTGEDANGISLRITNGRGNFPDGMKLSAGKDRQVKTNLDVDGNDVAWVSSIGTVYCLSRAPKV